MKYQLLTDRRHLLWTITKKTWRWHKNWCCKGQNWDVTTWIARTWYTGSRSTQRRKRRGYRYDTWKKRLKHVRLLVHNNPEEETTWAEMESNYEGPNGQAKWGSNTAAAKASTRPKLQWNCRSVRQARWKCEEDYNADEMTLKNTALHIKGKKTKLCLASRQLIREDLVGEEQNKNTRDSTETF